MRGDLSVGERDLVASELRHFDGLRYGLRAYVVMNDHVHVLVEPHPDLRLETILHSWKSYSAKAIGRLRQHKGTIWQDEYFDRAVRSESEYEQKRDYVVANAFRRWPELQTYRWCWAIGMERA